MRQLSAAARLGILALAVIAWAREVDAAEATANSATVLVLPFAPLNPAETQPWLGKSIQQSVVADLTAAAPGRVLSTDDTAADAAAAVDAAKRAGATVVVLGHVATAGNDLRVTGQVFDVSTGKPVTAIKATAPAADVFTLEDELAEQIRRRVALNPPRPAAASTQTTEASIPPMEPLRIAAVQHPADPYVQTFVTPLDPSSSPDRQQLDYNYYLGRTQSSTYFPICGWYGCGIGWGVGFSYFGGSWGSFTPASHGTNGVNPTAGTPIAPGVVFHPTGHASAGRAAGAGHR
ncbi:MAG TPA: hypothetical protein VGI81_07175 [Tepidisphaeraceae bacterium]|jgi:TolB-like protein